MVAMGIGATEVTIKISIMRPYTMMKMQMLSAQAMMHMWINAGLWPLTGQTLPMISDGKISFIAFSIAFGILLSISKMAKQKVDQAAMESEPLVVQNDDEVREGLDDLDKFESK